MKMYKANETQIEVAFENTMMLMHDKYGFDTVTPEFFYSTENDAEVSELVEASLEAIVSDGFYA